MTSLDHTAANILQMSVPDNSGNLFDLQGLSNDNTMYDDDASNFDLDILLPSNQVKTTFATYLNCHFGPDFTLKRWFIHFFTTCNV